MRKKPYKKKDDLSIEWSEVTHVISLDTDNLSIRVQREWRKNQKKVYS
jgi:hypothetical protein